MNVYSINYSIKYCMQATSDVKHYAKFLFSFILKVFNTSSKQIFQPKDKNVKFTIISYIYTLHLDFTLSSYAASKSVLRPKNVNGCLVTAASCYFALKT